MIMATSILVDRREPVGTNYTRVVPAKEINSAERENFWRKQEEDEMKRRESENQKKMVELSEHEKARRIKEESDHEKRELNTVIS